MTLAVELRGITKRFGPVVAVDAVDLRLRRGTVHAVMGENGAGKSTLMSVLYGLHRPDAGTIVREGREIALSSPLDAIEHRLGMVHQHFRLFDSMTVAENVVLGHEPRGTGVRRGLVDRDASVRRVRELSQRYGLEVDPAARVGTLSAGARQRVEILKALHRDAEVLILDEPTAVLTPGEVQSLFAVVRAAADDGATVVIVTHKIHEAMQISDDVTVLRGGRVAWSGATADTTPDALVEAMTGRVVVPAVNTTAPQLGEPVLEVEHLDVRDGDRHLVRDVSLTVRRGEIVGVAGVSGNGQHDLVAAVLGTVPATGTVRVAGGDVTGDDVRTRRAAGLAVVPEDRQGEGTAVTMSVAENLAMGHHRRPPLAGRGLRRGWLAPRAVRARAREQVAEHDVRTASEQLPAGSLSGGNAQKVVVARELAFGADVLVAEQPTQGVDIGAIESIHRRLLDYRADGHGVLLVSHEISELLALADRVLVMLDGRVVAELDRHEATAETIGAAMSGARDGGAA